jgi:pantetheine-phosphate adenylyltransferase
MKKIIAVYPGTFDPITKGHVDIIKRASNIFDRLIIPLVTVNISKNILFNIKERVKVTREVVDELGLSNVTVDNFNGLLIDYAHKVDATVIVRGLRAVSDFEYELQMAFMNRNLDPNIETVCMMPYIKYSFLSSSIVKEIFFNGGDITKFVPRVVLKYLLQKREKR